MDMSNPQPELDALLEQTLTRPAKKDRPQPPPRAGTWFGRWALSQVAAYRFGLILSYIGMIYFGFSAFSAGIPVFDFTAPQGWTPVWSSIVMIGGLVAAIGSLRAGEEPITPTIKRFNRTELVGSILLFLTLGVYAFIMLYLGYGYGELSRQAIGAGFVALGIHPSIRMIWLIFRPRFIAAKAFKESNQSNAEVL